MFCASFLTSLSIRFLVRKKITPHQTHRAIGRRIVFVKHENSAHLGRIFFFPFFTKRNIPSERWLKAVISSVRGCSRQETVREGFIPENTGHPVIFQKKRIPISCVTWAEGNALLPAVCLWIKLSPKWKASFSLSWEWFFMKGFAVLGREWTTFYIWQNDFNRSSDPVRLIISYWGILG